MIDIPIILAFIIYSVVNGFINRSRASRNLEEYFLAGRSIEGWKAGFSLAATQFAADTPLLVTGLIATGGIFMLWRLWIYGLGFLMIGFLLGRSWRRSGVITDAELTEIRYSGPGVLWLRGLKAVYYGTVMNCTIMAMVLIAATRISEVFLPWHLWMPDGIYGTLSALVEKTGIVFSSGLTGIDGSTATTNNIISIFLILAFTGLYSTTGGLRSVIATDTVQFSLAMIGTLIYAIVIIIKTGGLWEIPGKLADLYGVERAGRFLSYVPERGDALLPFLVIISLQWFFERNSDGTGYFAQRMMACRSDSDAKKAAFIFTWLQIFLRSLIWMVIGTGLLILYPISGSPSGEEFTAGREMLFATGIRDLLPPGVMGIMLTGMLAALASTIDTHLTWGAGYWSNDLYLRIINRAWLKREPKNRELVLAARFSNIIILAIALAIMANIGSIQTAWYITLLFGAGTGAVLVLRWVWERINLFSEISAIAVSLILAPVILFTVKEEWLRLLSMSMLSTVVVVTVTLFTRPEKDKILTGFYKKVEPPGFWRNTARAAGTSSGEPVRRFLGSMYMTLTVSISLYFLLVGFGRLMLPDPEGSWMHAVLYLATGLLAMPAWVMKLIKDLKQ